ncbi:extracellular solute-binding protein [Halorhabdus amylolytica]|uniref:extracellular solute-binding protein n=1 Tax=Halorhabdus amylolytica TaxID=2559573 RepID=UPI0010A9E9B9|nr:extracellular solute-binding protein [Halorhabdus amylolytica]
MSSDRAVSDSTETRSIDRRTFIYSVGATGVGMSLAGCGSGGDDTPTEGTGTTMDSGGQDSSGTTLQITAHQEWQDNADAVVSALHDAGMSEDIDVNMISPGQTTGDAQAQYQQWLSSNVEEPDLMVFDVGWTRPFIARDQLMDITEILPQDAVDRVTGDYFGSMTDIVTGPEGGLYGVPLYIDLPTIQYNKSHVAEAGYDWEQYATDPMSWKQFSQEMSDVYEQADVEYGFNWQAQSGLQLSCCVFNEFLTSWGGAFFGNPQENLFGPIGDRPITVEEEPVLEALRMGRAFIHGNDAPETLDSVTGNITSTEAFQWGLQPSMQPLTDGNAIALRNWPYSININGAEDALGEDLGVMPIPYGVPEGEGKYPGTGGSVGALGGWNYAVNPNTNRQQAAAEFLEAMTSESFQSANFGIAGHIPPVPGTLSEATDIDIMGRYVDALSYVGEHTMSRPATVVWSQQSQFVAQQANAALQDGDVAGAMSKLADQLGNVEQQYAQE